MSKKLIAIFLRQQGVDTTTRAGKELCQMLQAFVDFEHALASASVRAGLKRARAAGKKLGRPRIDSEAAIRKALSKKNRPGVRGIAKQFGISVSTVMRVKQSMEGK